MAFPRRKHKPTGWQQRQESPSLTSRRRIGKAHPKSIAELLRLARTATVPITICPPCLSKSKSDDSKG